MFNPQFDTARHPIHLLTPEGWPRALLGELLDRVDAVHAEYSTAAPTHPGLRVMPLFFTQAQAGLDIFKFAAAWQNWQLVPAPGELNARHYTPAQIAQRAEQADLLVMSHPASGAAHAVAAQMRTGVPVINVLDGRHAAPLAALADVATLRRRLPELNTRVVVLCGDLVADARLRSVVHVLTTLGVPRVNVVHVGTSLPEGAAQLGIHVFTAEQAARAYEGAAAVITYASSGATCTTDTGTLLTALDSRMVLHGAPSADLLPAPQQARGIPPAGAQACVLVAAADMLTGRG